MGANPGVFQVAYAPTYGYFYSIPGDNFNFFSDFFVGDYGRIRDHFGKYLE